MNYLRKVRNSRGVRGYAPPENFENLGLLGVFEQKRKHKSPLKLLGMYNVGKILLLFPNKSWPIQGSCFVATVSHVSRKI